MKIFMRAIWASPGVAAEPQVFSWDPSFSTLVLHLWQCCDGKGMLGSDSLLKLYMAWLVVKGYVGMLLNNASFFFRLAASLWANMKTRSTTSNFSKFYWAHTLPETWWLISLSDETYPLLTMTTISYYWHVSDGKFIGSQFDDFKLISFLQGLTWK